MNALGAAFVANKMAQSLTYHFCQVECVNTHTHTAVTHQFEHRHVGWGDDFGSVIVHSFIQIPPLHMDMYTVKRSDSGLPEPFVQVVFVQ